MLCFIHYHCRPLLVIEPIYEPAYPRKLYAEPAIFRDLLASEVEDELAHGVALERQSGIKEVHVCIALLVCILQCRPYRVCSRVEHHETLAARSQLPHVGVAAEEEANACADDTVSVFCCEYLAMLACCQVFEELAATHGASRLQSEVVAHELHGLLQFFAFRLYCCGFHSALFCSRNLVAKLLGQTFVRMF